MVHCICGKDKGGFMVFCDGCNKWFHGSCVKETAKTTQHISKWYCAWCAHAKELHDSLLQEHRMLKTRFDSLTTKNCDDLVNIKRENEQLRIELKTAVAAMNETHVPKELHDSLMQEHNMLKTRYDSLLSMKDEELVCLRNENEKLKLECEEIKRNNLTTKNYDDLVNLKRENEQLRIELKTAVAAMNETHVPKELHDSLMQEHNMLKTRYDSLSMKNEELVCLRNENEKLKLECEEINRNNLILRQEKIDLQKTLKLHRGKRLSLSQK